MAKTKSGYVYLLKSQTEDGVYKVGCTTLDPNQRAKRVNYEYKSKHGVNYKFSVIDAVKVKNPYGIESIIKAYIVPCGFCMEFEVFHLSLCDFDEKELVSRFNRVIEKKGMVA